MVGFRCDCCDTLTPWHNQCVLHEMQYCPQCNSHLLDLKKKNKISFFDIGATEKKDEVLEKEERRKLERRKSIKK